MGGIDAIHCCIQLLHLSEGTGELVGLDPIQVKNLRKYERGKMASET
jgi:hypothetical protein